MPRFIPMIYRVGDEVAPSFALAASSAAANAEPRFTAEAVKLGDRSIALDLGFHLPIRYYGPRGAIKQFSASKALRGVLDPREIRGKIVVLGVTALGVGDTFATPFDRLVPGAEVVATGIGNLLAGGGLIRTAMVRRIDAAASILLPCLTVLLMATRRAFTGVAFAGLVIALWLALTFAAFAQGYWLSISVPLAALAPVAIAYGAARLGLDRLLARRLAADRAALMTFQSPLLVEHILRTPDFLREPVQQNVAVVFIDLSGFTGVTEKLGPAATRELLAPFQAMIEREVSKHGGFVTGFAGDGAMTIFGLPHARPDDAARAVSAIFDLYAATLAWLQTLPRETKDRLSVRIGGHFGKAVVSRLGATNHQHITATGDTVNVASRLLEVAKQQGRPVVVSEDLFLAAQSPLALEGDVVEKVEVAIRGRNEPVQIRSWG